MGTKHYADEQQRHEKHITAGQQQGVIGDHCSDNRQKRGGKPTTGGWCSRHWAAIPFFLRYPPPNASFSDGGRARMRLIARRSWTVLSSGSEANPLSRTDLYSVWPDLSRKATTREGPLPVRPEKSATMTGALTIPARIPRQSPI